MSVIQFPLVTFKAIARVAGYIRRSEKMGMWMLASVCLGMLLTAISLWQLLERPAAVVLNAWCFWLPLGVVLVLVLGWTGLYLWVKSKQH